MTPRTVPPHLRLPALAILLNAVLAIPPATLGQSPPSLKLRLKVTSSSASVAKGLNLQLQAAHVFPNSSTADVTRRAIWMSSNPQIAIVSNLATNLATKQGTITGVNPGVVTITAISGPERGSLNITVTGPAIVAVTVAPPNDSVAVSATLTYTATASFSDQSTPQDITNTATWSSTPNANMSGHTASGITPGIATITALDPASKVTGRTSLNVGLGSIAVNPANPSIPLGTTQQFTAMGNFNNGSPVPIAVQWTSSLPQVVTISPSGLAQSLTTGTATITATSGTVSGSTTLQVGPAIPKFIAVRPSNGNIGIGATLQFSAAQIYTDGSIAPLSGASWSSSLPAVAGIDPAKGLLTAFSPGTTTITATSGSLTGSATLSVSFTRFAYLSNAMDGTVSIYSVGPTGRWRDHGYVLLGSNAQPRTPATTPAGAFLYVPQSGAGSIAAFAIDGSGNLAALPGSPFASEIAPNQVVVGPNGQFAYVPNSGSGTISQYSIDSTGALLDLAPAAVAAGVHPAFLAIDPSGKFLYSANTGSSTVTSYAIDQTDGTLGPPGTVPSGGSSPQSLAIDPTGSFLLVANSGVSGAGIIASFAINPATGVLSPAPGSPYDAQGGAESITIDPVGKYAYSANGGSNTVSAFQINSLNGALIMVGSPTAAPGGPNAVRVDVSGTQLYVVRSQSNELSTFSINATTGALTALRVTRTRNGPYDLAMTTGQPMQYLPKFALVSFSNANVAETFTVNANSGALSSLPVSSASQGPAVTDYSGAASAAADPSGSFAYVANQAGAEVFGYGINPNSGALAAVANSPIAAGPVLKQLAVEASGRFIYAVNCADTNNVRPYTLQNLALTGISGGAANAGSCPFAVATDPTGRFVYVANFVDSTISTFAIDPATGVLQQIGSPLMSARPTGITVHPSGKFAYVINTPCSCPGTIQIFAIDALTGALSGGNTILSIGLNPAAVTLDPDGKFLYVVDFGGVDSTTNAALILPGDITAFAVNENTGNLTPITGSPYMVAYSADGVSIEPSGKFLYLTIRGDVGNHYPDVISVFSIDPKSGQLNLSETMTFSPPGQGPSSIVITGAIQ